MSSFPKKPAISKDPVVDNHESSNVIDPAIQSPLESGLVRKRARFTAHQKMWQVQFVFLSNSDKQTLEAFVDSVNITVNWFTWSNPTDGYDYQVRIASKPAFKLVDNNAMEWNVLFSFQEAYPNSRVVTP